jgi:hypothetical protein
MKVRWAVALVLLWAASVEADAVVWLGASGDARANGSTFDAAGSADTRMLGGGRMTLSLERAAPARPAPRKLVTAGRIVPELIGGFVVDGQHVEGYVGLGLRAEGWLSTSKLRTAIYAAARPILIGGHQDRAIELVIGEYLLFGGGKCFGWEGGAMIRPRDGVAVDQSRELDAMMQLYVGW